jgi:hypothetical protein
VTSDRRRRIRAHRSLCKLRGTRRPGHSRSGRPHAWVSLLFCIESECAARRRHVRGPRLCALRALCGEIPRWASPERVAGVRRARSRRSTMKRTRAHRSPRRPQASCPVTARPQASGRFRRRGAPQGDRRGQKRRARLLAAPASNSGRGLTWRSTCHPARTFGTLIDVRGRAAIHGR